MQLPPAPDDTLVNFLLALSTHDLNLQGVPYVNKAFSVGRIGSLPFLPVKASTGVCASAAADHHEAAEERD